MASTKYKLYGKNPAGIYLRFYHGRSIDMEVPTGLMVNKELWDEKKGRIRNKIEVPNRDDINSKLARLEIEVIDEYNLAHSTGEIINSAWLKTTISKFFNRPKSEEKGKIDPSKLYLSDFAALWLKDKAPKYKVKANKYMDSVTICHYQSLLDNLIEHEGKNKIRLDKVTADVMDDFSQFLTGTKKYSTATAKRKMGRFKFFCERAEEENLEVNKNYRQRVFVKEEEVEYKMPYLNELEIKKISKLDLSHDPKLDIARDNLIIGLWTGQRISDFLTRLSIGNFEGDFIKIKTKKTGHTVSIPLHPMVKDVLQKYKGQLPPKQAEQKFNDYIKIVSQLADIDEVMTGGVSTVEEKGGLKRKVVGSYPKYKLVTSHICRRSFCTNLFGKVPNKVIMDVAGWKSEQQMYAYNKSTNLESAKALQKHWEQQY